MRNETLNLSLPLYSNGLTVLSFGAGQDSTAILYKCVSDETWRERFRPAGEDFIVVFSDTGDEHEETYEHLTNCAAFCETHGLRLEILTSERRFHSPAWASLIEQYRRNRTVGCKAYVKSCTDNLKIQPIYRFVEHVLRTEYGCGGPKKEPFYSYLRLFGRPVRMLLGIAAGEESRVADHSRLPLWMRDCVSFSYPLIEAGMDRHACQAYIRALGRPVPMPSNCKRCPYVSEVELVWLHRFRRADYEEWVQLESAKLAKFAHLGARNYGVFGPETLPETLAKALLKYGGWSDAQLWDHKISHGHCVKSKY
jgi:hypothetical protein